MDSTHERYAKPTGQIATRPDARGIVAFPWVTGIFVAVVLLAWVLVAVQQGLAGADGGLRSALLHGPSDALLLHDGALDGATLARGEWWRLLTSQELHVKLGHMLLNAVGLAIVGAALERRIGSWRLLVIAVLGGVTGQLASALAYPTLVSSGASQAALALVAALGVIAVRQWLRRDARLDISDWIGIAVAALYLCISLALDLSAAHTIKAGHSAAFVAGALLAVALGFSKPSRVQIAQ
ncbi:MAG TPA: rhomboid family intramembrane serine protease [Ktedonobacterales bacterium]